MTDEQKIQTILKRRAYFDLHFPVIERCDARTNIAWRLSNSCPSCGYLTLYARCSWDICPFCFWEDDGQDNYEADEVCSGPNSHYSLTAYRLEMYDWMDELREKKSTNSSIGKSIGEELSRLDGHISRNELDRQLVLNQIKLLSKMFGELRQINDDSKPNWRFLTEEQMIGIKPAYQNNNATL